MFFCICYDRDCDCDDYVCGLEFIFLDYGYIDGWQELEHAYLAH